MEWKTADLVETDWEKTVTALARHMGATDHSFKMWEELSQQEQERYVAMAKTFLGYLKTSPFRLIERAGNGGATDGR